MEQLSIDARYGRDRFSLATYLRTFLKILDIHDFAAELYLGHPEIVLGVPESV